MKFAKGGNTKFQCYKWKKLAMPLLSNCVNVLTSCNNNVIDSRYNNKLKVWRRERQQYAHTYTHSQAHTQLHSGRSKTDCYGSSFRGTVGHIVIRNKYMKKMFTDKISG